MARHSYLKEGAEMELASVVVVWASVVMALASMLGLLAFASMA
jgi:hypothetical protein